jgi:hypothetical protein
MEISILKKLKIKKRKYKEDNVFDFSLYYNEL